MVEFEITEAHFAPILFSLVSVYRCICFLRTEVSTSSHTTGVGDFLVLLSYCWCYCCSHHYDDDRVAVILIIMMMIIIIIIIVIVLIIAVVLVVGVVIIVIIENIVVTNIFIMITSIAVF